MIVRKRKRVYERRENDGVGGRWEGKRLESQETRSTPGTLSGNRWAQSKT